MDPDRSRTTVHCGKSGTKTSTRLRSVGHFFWVPLCMVANVRAYSNGLSGLARYVYLFRELGDLENACQCAASPGRPVTTVPPGLMGSSSTTSSSLGAKFPNRLSEWCSRTSLLMTCG